MSTLPKHAQHEKRAKRPIPRLQDGDQLSRVEFERRYAGMPGLTKAELIEGEVHMPSPVREEEHGYPHTQIGGWAMHYAVYTRGVRASDNTTVRLDGANEPQPDTYLRILPHFGGASKTTDGYVEGAPELVIEVSASTVSIDLHKKLKAYERNGVREYIVWRVEDEAIDWLALVDGRFQPIAAEASGVLKSGVFPGLWLDAAALLRDDLARVLSILQEGIASPEHAAFVAALASRESPAGGSPVA